MRAPRVKRIFTGTAARIVLGLLFISVLLVYGEGPGMAVVYGSVELMQRWAPVEWRREFIAQCIAAITGLSLAGAVLSGVATIAIKPRRQKGKETKSKPDAAPKAGSADNAQSKVGPDAAVKPETGEVSKPKQQGRIARWRKRFTDRRDKQGNDWLKRGKPLGFVAASYIGGSTLVAGWAASAKKPHPFRLGVIAGIVLAVPSGFTWTVLMYRQLNWWMVPVIWIAWALLIQVGVTAYQSRYVRLDWWLFRFIPDLFTGRRFKRNLSDEIRRLRLERMIATAPTGPSKCTKCTNRTQRTYCASCNEDTECPQHHIVKRTPYALYVVWHGDPTRKYLWKAAVRCEQDVFWQEDGNGPFSLYRAARRWLAKTALVVIVDQRPDENGRPRDAVMGIMRLTWGSQESLITMKSLRGKPWSVRNFRLLMRATKVPVDLGSTRHAMDFTMLAIRREYQLGGAYYDDNVRALCGLLAQCGHLAEDTDTRYWITIMSRQSEAIIKRITKAPWRPFANLEAYECYFGSRGSRPLWLNFHEWKTWLPEEYPQVFQDIFGDGLSEHFSLEPHKDLREFSALT